MNTLLLDVGIWDLVKDASGNIAIASAPYSLAQDVASAIRTFLHEVWYVTTQGIPYLQSILGKTPPLAVFQELMVQAALGAVPTTADVYVKEATCVIQTFNAPSRLVVGQVQFVDSNGQTGTVQVGQIA